MPEAAVIRDGLVVASVGLNFCIDCMSPVSATTVVYCLSCSRSVAMTAHSGQKLIPDVVPQSQPGCRHLARSPRLTGSSARFCPLLVRSQPGSACGSLAHTRL